MKREKREESPFVIPRMVIYLSLIVAWVDVLLIAKSMFTSMFRKYEFFS